MTDKLAIQTDRLTRTFGAVRAVDDLTLNVPAGIVFGFLGPNGSGKTTTIRLLLGLLNPTAGRAEVLGHDTLKEGQVIRECAGALLEHNGLYERLSAEDNLDFYGRVWHLSSGERHERIHELLSHLGLWDRRKEHVGAWSRGMKQKLAVARALLHRPSLVFLDEPTAGLDPKATVALRDDLVSLTAREGVTVFLTTHNLAEAEKICSQVGLIRNGRLLAIGSPADLRARSGAPQAEIIGAGFSDAVVAALRQRPEVAAVERFDARLTIGLKAAGSVAPLVSLLVQSGVQIEEVHKGEASFEDAILALIEEEK
jgi:ABC-2 type transport system ATP-binding protein